MTLPAGGITALVGPNGAGKSNLLTMVGRLLDIDTGTITVGGLNVATTKPKELDKVLSVLRQENHFVTKLTVRQLVGFGRFPYTGGRRTAEDEEIISKYIDFLNLTELEHRYLMNFPVASASGPTLPWRCARKPITFCSMNLSITWISPTPSR